MGPVVGFSGQQRSTFWRQRRMVISLINGREAMLITVALPLFLRGAFLSCDLPLLAYDLSSSLRPMTDPLASTKHPLYPHRANIYTIDESLSELLP